LKIGPIILSVKEFQHHGERTATLNFKAIKKASMTLGLYRQARFIQRHLDKNVMNTFVSTKSFYSQLLPQPNLQCFDVGANMGEISEVLLMLGHNVVAFEPQVECVQELKARCSQFKDHLRVEETALGDSDGTASLFLRESSCQTSLRTEWEGTVTNSIQVPVSTLDIAIERFGIPHYCKIDVEGWESHVLQGLSQPIPLISFEYHQDDDNIKDAYLCLERLRSLSKISVNITPREQSHFALDEWVDSDDFKAVFEAKFQGQEDFLWGDLYVRAV
jgi:FkbM family methyltransferase